MSNNIINLKDFDINKINIENYNSYKINDNTIYYTINLNYNNDIIPLINLEEMIQNNNLYLIYKYNIDFYNGPNDKNRYHLHIYKDMFLNNDIINFSNNLKNLILKNEKMDEIFNILKINKNKINKHFNRYNSFYKDYSFDNHENLNHIDLSLPNKNGKFADEFKIYKKIKDNNIVEIENINDIDDLYNLLDKERNCYSKLSLIPFIKIKHIYIFKVNNSFNIGFKINLEKLIIDYSINEKKYNKNNFLFGYFINMNKYNDINNFIINNRDKSDYLNDFNNIFNIFNIK